MAGEFDRTAAVTRSLLGWGVVAGPFFLVVGLVLAVTRDGFDLTRHTLSLLELGDLGWLQRGNLVITAIMVFAASYGVLRAVRSGRGLAMGSLIAVFGFTLVLAALVGPDPSNGFPTDAVAETTAGGTLHTVFTALGSAALVGTAFAYASWARAEGDPRQATLGMLFGLGIAAAFLSGAALAPSTVGVVLLGVAAIGGFAFLAILSSRLYAFSPHPVIAARAA